MYLSAGFRESVGAAVWQRALLRRPFWKLWLCFERKRDSTGMGKQG